MALIAFRYIGPVVALVCCSSSLAWATEPPPADGAAAPPAAGDPAAATAPPAPAAPPAEPAKKDDEPDPKTRPAPNTIYAELAGAGTIYSLNYERRVIDDLGVRLGFTFFATSASVGAGGTSASASYKFIAIPITASWLGLRSGKHGLEAGGGITIRYDQANATIDATGAEASATDVYGTAFVGYRLHPVGKAGFNFRIGAMAMIGKYWNYLGDNPAEFGVMPFGYLSMGASF